MHVTYWLFNIFQLPPNFSWTWFTHKSFSSHWKCGFHFLSWSNLRESSRVQSLSNCNCCNYDCLFSDCLTTVYLFSEVIFNLSYLNDFSFQSGENCCLMPHLPSRFGERDDSASAKIFFLLTDFCEAPDFVGIWRWKYFFAYNKHWVKALSFGNDPDYCLSVFYRSARKNSYTLRPLELISSKCSSIKMVHLIELKFGTYIIGHRSTYFIGFGEFRIDSFFTGAQNRNFIHYSLWSQIIRNMLMSKRCFRLSSNLISSL